MDPELKILVVDDELANLQKMQRTLIGRYPVLAASSGREALEIIRREDSIAVIIADQRMPGMTGLELFRETLALLPQAIRIILTGYTDVDVLLEAINRCRVYRYMVKPWDPRDLLMTVERGLESYRLSLENERFRKELIRRERLARELEIARDIQRYILPRQQPDLPGYEMAVAYHPAREVGGDLYDWDYDADTNILRVVVGDVSGKSIPAALYGAVFSGHIQALFADSLGPGEALRFLNGRLLQRYEGDQYIAACYISLDLKTGHGRLANGGMPFPYVFQNGRVSQVAVAGVPLGIMPDNVYEECDVSLQPGGLLLLVSDGVIDAQNPAGDMYGEEVFCASVLRHAGKPIAELVENLYAEIVHFAEKTDLDDDVAVVGLRRAAS